MYRIFGYPMDWITLFALASLALMCVTVLVLFWLSRPQRTVLYKGDCKHDRLKVRLGSVTGTCTECGATMGVDEWRGGYKCEGFD